MREELFGSFILALLLTFVFGCGYLIGTRTEVLQLQARPECDILMFKYGEEILCERFQE
jgi:hypothetical protein